MTKLVLFVLWCALLFNVSGLIISADQDVQLMCVLAFLAWLGGLATDELVREFIHKE